MSARAMVLCYHAIEAGPPPLCVDPALFREHLAVIASSKVRVVALGRLADELEDGGPEEATVAITFDDGYASVVQEAVPMLSDRGLPATIFAVAGHLGGLNDWPTEPPSAPRLRLATADELADLAGRGIEVGSHGMTHLPLSVAGEEALEREIVSSREALEAATGAPVRWFAYPGGAKPGTLARALIERTYDGAADGGNRPAGSRPDRWAMPRVEIHYLRRPALLRRALSGADLYLLARRLGGRTRRLMRPDYVRPANP